MQRRALCGLLLLVVTTSVACHKHAAAAVPPIQPMNPVAPAPVITLRADRLSIADGESVTLAWEAKNATLVRITDVGDVATNGRRPVLPHIPTTYTATATGPGGTAADAVRITVRAREAAVAPPVVVSATTNIDESFKSNIEDVLFDYDRAAIRVDQYLKLSKVVRWLRENPQSRIVIEGNCDDRGSQEYNIALGDLRATAVRNYLIEAGIDQDRLKTISYGEERPICLEATADCWIRNRRAHFERENPL